MMWSATRPKVEGWFVWREDIEEAPTLIQVWMAKKRRGNGTPHRATVGTSAPGSGN